MRRVALGILIGTAGLQQLSSLPTLSWSFLLASFFALWANFYFLKSHFLPRNFWTSIAAVFFSAGMGFFSASIAGHALLSGELPRELEGQDVVVEGLIASLPEPSAFFARGQKRTRFQFAPDILHWQGESQALPGKLLLSWYQNPPALRVGERWRLKVRLKRPHGFMNPGGFDYEAWLFR